MCPIADRQAPKVRLATTSGCNVLRVIRLGLLLALVPTALLSLFFVAYALFNFEFWISEVSLPGKLLAASTVAVAATAYFLLRQERWTVHRLQLGAFVVLVSIAGVAYILPGLIEDLGRF